MDRPAHLPIYDRPPLNEVVCGVQFNPPQDFTSIRFRDVWELFRAEFPRVDEQLPLQPQFETFGGPAAQTGLQFQLEAPPRKTRMWFISADESHLLQFQDDRLLLNWRRREDGTGYPQFEGIFPILERSLGSLSTWFRDELRHEMAINQAEMSYINLVPVVTPSQPQEWFTFLNASSINLETSNVVMSEVLKDESGKPNARFFHELVTVQLPESREKAYRLSLTVRGAPRDGTLTAGLDFIREARERIVGRFEELTTVNAKNVWGRN
jgi:uncharacterized protein (TIGR04255 family)